MRRYFKDYAPPGYVTLEGYHSTCSYGKLRFWPGNQRIEDNITIPCYGAQQALVGLAGTVGWRGANGQLVGV